MLGLFILVMVLVSAFLLLMLAVGAVVAVGRPFSR